MTIETRRRTPRRMAEPRSTTPQLRRSTLRVRIEAVTRLGAGHPWVFRDALGHRGDLPAEAGQVVTLQDPDGRFVAYGLFEPEGAVAVKVLSTNPDEVPGPELYRRRVAAALARRQALIEADTTAYRLINSEGDGLPGLTVDRFGEYLVSHVFSNAAAALADAVYPEVMERTGAKGLYEQKRLRPAAGERRPPAELRIGLAADPQQEAAEHGLRFAVDVTAPLGVGLFPDLREARRWVGQHARGLRVLNCFSYTGAFTVHALAGGATHLTSVDLATKSHTWARRNLQLNGISEDHHVALASDMTAAVERLKRHDERFDLIIVDPPSFSRSSGGTFSGGRDYADLVATLLPLLRPEGLLLAVSNMAKLPEDEFARGVGRGGALVGRTLRVVRRFPLPPDFPYPPAFAEGSYLKAYLCQG